jgi:hypothetical protein
MSSKDKIKLAIAIVVLAGAGVLLYFNLRPSKPGQVVSGSSNTQSPTPNSGESAPAPGGGRGGRFTGK